MFIVPSDTEKDNQIVSVNCILLQLIKILQNTSIFIFVVYQDNRDISLFPLINDRFGITSSFKCNKFLVIFEK